MQELPTIQPTSTGRSLARGDRCPERGGARARRRSATRSSSPTTTSCPRSRTSPTTSATRSASRARPPPPTPSAIAFCGVHFMAETASILSPEKTVLIPDLDAGCSLADSIDADQLRAWKAEHPGAMVVMYVNTSAEVKAETDYCCTSSNAVKVVEHIWARARPGHRDPLRPRHVAGRLRRARDRPGRGPRAPRPLPRLGRRVPRPRRNPSRGHRPDPRRAPRGRVPDPPRVRLLDPGDGVRRLGRHRPRGRPHALDLGDARARRSSTPTAASSSPPRTGCSTRCSRRRRGRT